uniref:Reverse transcriptase zinc-binding domain-containing protein n=2 Tax=Opuntia streptacantha TaxID=393608 RepID=A0A7C9F570_OPUST
MGWFEGHMWKWALAWKRELTQQEVELVTGLTDLLSAHFPLPNQEDTIHWKGGKEYSAKVLQQLLYMEMEVEVESLVCSVWLNLVPPKVEFFMWLVLLGKLNTKEMLCKKGVLSVNQTSCSFCSSHTESLDHVLLNCPFSWRVWCSTAADLGQQLVYHTTFKQFYSSCLSIHWRSKCLKKIWISAVFAVTWRLWMVRNELIFHQKELNLTEVCHSIKWNVAVWTRAWKELIPYKVEELARNFSSLPEILH